MRTFLFALLLASVALAKIQSGTVTLGTDDWFFITKFTFDTSGEGIMLWDVTYTNPNTSNVYWSFYDDQPDQWPAVFGNKSLDCNARFQSAAARHAVRPINSQPQKEGFLDHYRPHIWYIVLSNCGGQPSVVNYNLHLTNADGGWGAEFSFDEQGIAALYLSYWLIFTVVFGINLWAVRQFWLTQSFHILLRLFSIGLALQYFSLFFNFAHWVSYKDNGVGSGFCRGFGEFLDMASQIVLLLLLVLIAKGWNISNLDLGNKYAVVGPMAAVTLAYLVLFIWDEVGFDPASSVYLYDTAPGIMTLVIRSLILIWFCWALYQSYTEETTPAKRRFYIEFGVFYVTWFVVLPFIVIIAAGLPGYTRFKVVQSMYVTANVLGYAVLSWLFWPTRTTEYFQISKGDALFAAPSQARATSYDTL